MATPTTIKPPEALRGRIDRLAKAKGDTTRRFLLTALEREVEREESIQEFVLEALASDKAIENGEPVYSADKVRDWLEQLAQDTNATKPSPCRK